MEPRIGTLWYVAASDSWMSPPSMMVSPSRRRTVESRMRLLIVGGRVGSSPPTGVENSGLISVVTSPEALTQGVISSRTLASIVSKRSDSWSDHLAGGRRAASRS